jgi:hypothetical protein
MGSIGRKDSSSFSATQARLALETHARPGHSGRSLIVCLSEVSSRISRNSNGRVSVALPLGVSPIFFSIQFILPRSPFRISVCSWIFHGRELTSLRATLPRSLSFIILCFYDFFLPYRVLRSKRRSSLLAWWSCLVGGDGSSIHAMFTVTAKFL